MVSRELLFNTEVENVVLGSIINNPNLLYRLNDLPEQVFYSTKNQEVFGMLRYILSDKGNLDLVLIGDYILKRKPKNITVTYVSTLISTTIAGNNFSSYLDILVDLHKKRQIQRGIGAIDYSLSAEDIKSDILSSMNNVYIDKEDEKMETTIFNTIDSILSNEVEKGIMTGYRDLDENLLGFGKSQLITISARSGIGKTTFAVNTFTYQVMRGYKPMYFSLEMPKSELIKKMLSIQGMIEQHKLRKHTVNEKERETLCNLAEIFAKKTFNIFDKDSSIEYITGKIREEHIKGNCDIVYIDLINRVTTAKRSGSRAEEIGNITRQLKQLAMELEIPIVILAQINRGAEQRVDKRPMLSDLKESGSIEEDSDIVISIYRNLQTCNRNYDGKIDYNSNDPDLNPERVEVALMKSRYTGSAILPMIYMAEFGIIKEKMR